MKKFIYILLLIALALNVRAQTSTTYTRSVDYATADSDSVNYATRNLWWWGSNGYYRFSENGTKYSLKSYIQQFSLNGSGVDSRIAFWNGANSLTSSPQLQFSTAGGLTLANSMVQSGTNTNVLISPTISANSGSVTRYGLRIWPTINNTALFSGDNILLDINPTLTATTGTTLYSLRATSGQALLGGSSVTANTRLDIRGFGTSAATSGLRVANSSNNRVFQVFDDGTTTMYSNGNSRFVFNGSSGLLSQTYANGTTGGSMYTMSGTFSGTSGSNNFVGLNVSPTYNTTGTYSGTVRGMYYNPTVTSLTGATHIAFENTSGDIRLALDQDDTKERVLVQDETTNKVFWRDVSTLGGGGGWPLSGEATLTGSVYITGGENVDELVFGDTEDGEDNEHRLGAFRVNVGDGDANPQPNSFFSVSPGNFFFRLITDEGNNYVHTESSLYGGFSISHDSIDNTIEYSGGMSVYYNQSGNYVGYSDGNTGEEYSTAFDALEKDIRLNMTSTSTDLGWIRKTYNHNNIQASISETAAFIEVESTGTETLYTFTPSDGTLYTIKGVVQAHDGIDDAAVYEFSQSYFKGGALSPPLQIGSGGITTVGETDSSWDFDINISGNDLIFEVTTTPDALEPVKWTLLNFQVIEN